MNRNRSSSSHNLRNSQSQDFLNASFDVARPQGGSHSPIMQGRSVRELEEQMSSLRKENFNLKLRIYFMEEGQPGARANHSPDSLNKQLIDAKIENELLRKTVDEKMELLKDAARAISHHEDMQRKADFESQTIIDELQDQIRSYEMAESGKGGEKIAFDDRKLQRLESEVQKLEEELVESDLRNTKIKHDLEFTLAERLETITACEAKIQELAIKNAELVDRLEKDAEAAETSNRIIEQLKVTIEECRAENQNLVSSISAIEVQLGRQVSSMKETNNTIDVQRQSIQLLEGTIKRKEKSYGSILNSLLEYEALIAKLNAELDILRKENVYFRDLSDNLQQKKMLQWDHGVAIVPPIRTAADTGVGITNSSECSGSTSSLHSNLSSISVLCGSPGPSSHKSLCQWKSSQQQQQQQPHRYPNPQFLQQRVHHHNSHATLLAVTAPSTAFYNYSLPSFTGFRQFLWRWGT